jgi:hypothetical protein
MATLLTSSVEVLLLGCGGGTLATMLHRRGSRVTVVDANPMSFQLARTFFWMPNGIECITADMRAFVHTQSRRFDSNGIDVGGPCFSYEKVLGPDTISNVRRALRDSGCVAVNISCEAPGDPVPGRIATRFRDQGLDVWVFMEDATASDEVNAVVLASLHAQVPAVLAKAASGAWSLARLAE